MFAFAFPALLVGAAAAGLPWLIHMILRPRPARVRFPAVSLLHSVLVAGRRASKLRNLWLLMIRTLTVALLAFLLAGPTCRTRGGAVDRSGPIAGVIVFDDSLSMTYRLDERTLAQIAEDQLSQLLSEPQALKSASDWGIVFAGDDGPPPPFRTTINAARGEESDAIVAPVSPAWELVHGHQFDRRYAKVLQPHKLRNQRVERARLCVGPDVQFVDDERIAIQPLPGTVSPDEC